MDIGSTSAPFVYPAPRTYEQEYLYWPWGELIETVIRHVVRLAPLKGRVVDYMCGTGYLLSKIRDSRPDLHLVGCSLGPSDYIKYGTDKYPGIKLFQADALVFALDAPVDVVICTGGIHHLHPEARDLFLRKITSELRSGGWLIIGEEVLSPHIDEASRRTAVLELNLALLTHSILRNAPPELLQAGLDVLRADLFQLGEYKLTEESLKVLIRSYIPIFAAERVWPSDSQLQYGDLVLICGPRGSK